MSKRTVSLLRVSLLAILLLPNPGLAVVRGLCSDCHTMHNSQEGSLVAFSRDNSGQIVLSEVPFNRLLKTDCVGCHSDASANTTLDTGMTKTPIVFNLTEPSYPADGSSSAALAGGNFYWVAHEGDQYGHNVYGISAPDSRLGGEILAPGGVAGTDACASCHRTLATAQTGCNGCHVVQHHAAGTGAVAGIDEGWYRFLGSVMQRDEGVSTPPDGVAGIEDPDWEQNPLATRHNSYQGTMAAYGDFLDTRSISQKCAGCHGQFHGETMANLAWIRHPVDVVIPNTAEFSGLTSYNPLVPVALQSLTSEDANRSEIQLGSDVVACLSCHRAHGSPYPAMLRWAYRAWPGVDPYSGGPAFNGCAICHTSKN